MFWVDLVGKVITRAFMDATGAQNVVTGVESKMEGLTMDTVTERLFWIQDSTASIETAKSDGSDRYTIIGYQQKSFTSIAAFEGFLYLTEGLLKSVEKVSSFLGRPVLAVMRAMRDKPSHVRVVHPLLQADVPNACADKSCRYLCVLGESGARCVCPDDVLMDNCPDEKRSQAIAQKPNADIAAAASNSHGGPIPPLSTPPISYFTHVFFTLRPPTTTPATQKPPTPQVRTTQRALSPAPPLVNFQTPRPMRGPFGNLWNTAPPRLCEGFCENGGTCSLTHGAPVCSCLGAYRGSRCDILPGVLVKTPSTPSTPEPPAPNATTATLSQGDDGQVGLAVGLVVMVVVLVILGYGAYRFFRTRRVATDLISRITYRYPNFKTNVEEGVVLVSDAALYRCAFTEEEESFYKKGRCWKASSSSSSSADSAISSRNNSPTAIYHHVSPSPTHD